MGTPEVEVFLDDIADKPPVIDEGKLVLVEVADANVKFGRESGDPYINLENRVTEDPEDEGAPLYDILPLPLEKREGESAKAYKKRMDRRCYRLKQAALAFGVKLAGGRKPVEVAEAFIGRRAWCKTKLDTDQRDQQQSRPDGYYPENEKPEEEKA